MENTEKNINNQGTLPPRLASLARGQDDIRKIKSWLKKSMAIYLVVILVLLAFGSGMWLGKKSGKIQVVIEPGQVSENGQKYGQVTGKNELLPDYLKKDVNFNLFWQVWQKIQEEYIDRPVGETKLLYGALSGLVSGLGDPYSVFLEPAPAKEFSDDLKGKFEGIGAEIGLRDNVITIISPLPDSPAEKAGLKAADKIVEIDGKSTEKMSLNEAVNRIRGQKGTLVVLKIFREKDGGFHEFKVTREVIKIVSVKWEMKNEIAYLKITNFNEDTDARFKQAVKEILLKNPKGIILDLRNNPGGYLDRAVTIASYWLPMGETVVQEEFANKDKKQYLANGEAQFKGYPAVVLVNQGSASASEIVAGALQDYGAAKLVGEKTFGKGSVQTLEELADGSAVKLTMARWLTPKGRQINVMGIEPDEKVELSEEDFKSNRDPQLEKALEMLRVEADLR